MADFHVGQHVWANFGAGERLSHVGGPEVDGKYPIQNPETGRMEALGYREPEDRDAEGSGRTFWKI